MNGRAVFPGHVDNWHRVARFFEVFPQLDSRPAIVQIDIEEDAKAKGLLKLALVFEGLRALKQHGLIAMPPKQSVHRPEHSRVVIHDKNTFSVWQERSLPDARRHIRQKVS